MIGGAGGNATAATNLTANGNVSANSAATGVLPAAMARLLIHMGLPEAAPPPPSPREPAPRRVRAMSRPPRRPPGCRRQRQFKQQQWGGRWDRQASAAGSNAGPGTVTVTASATGGAGSGGYGASFSSGIGGIGSVGQRHGNLQRRRNRKRDGQRHRRCRWRFRLQRAPPRPTVELLPRSLARSAPPPAAVEPSPCRRPKPAAAGVRRTPPAPVQATARSITVTNAVSG